MFNRTTHGWSQFAGHPELGFIDTEWLQRYRKKRENIVHQRVRSAETHHLPLTETQRFGSAEETIIDKKTIDPIRILLRKHLRWHPFKYQSTMRFPDNVLLTSRSVWLWQGAQMHDLCKKSNEGFAWEYLWDNWYKFDKWMLWARAANLNYYPIIQTNAAVETHWNGIKNHTLLWSNRIRIDNLCHEIHQHFLPPLRARINQYRRGIRASPWYQGMVSEWKGLQERITEQDQEDNGVSLPPDDPENPATERQRRMVTQHRTDVDLWRCECFQYNVSPNHICSHLLRLFGGSYPLKGESARQHTSPLLWIKGFHRDSQRVVVLPPTPREKDPHTNLETLEQVKRIIEDQAEREAGDIDAEEDDEVQYSRYQEDMKAWEEWVLRQEKACVYARKEMEASRERFRRLPKPSTQGWNTVVRLSDEAHGIDHSRKRIPTWDKRRRGNLYRD